MKFHRDVLAAHALFGGDLVGMQRRYDATVGNAGEAAAWQNIATLSNPEALVVVDDATVERACDAFTSTWADEESFAKAHYRKNMRAALSAALVAAPPAPTSAVDTEEALMAIGEELGLTSVTAYNCIDAIRWMRSALASTSAPTVVDEPVAHAEYLMGLIESYVSAKRREQEAGRRTFVEAERQSEAAKHAIAAALSAQAVPAPMGGAGELVKALTPKMAEAGRAKLVELGYEGVDFTDAQQVYLAMRDAALNPETPAAPEVAWLIERKFPADGLQPPETRWYAENRLGFHWWTPTAAMAKRFTSKADVEAFNAYLMIDSDPTISITEHVFIAALPEAPAAPVGEP
ncbi:hypothetical protein [Mesorhizobium sp. M0520]|uniref:hypothetical protein n=1 Tax=Mesorhizobium sp. M0520 TaxID=2956957 RepID=UPI003335502C